MFFNVQVIPGQRKKDITYKIYINMYILPKPYTCVYFIL